MQSVCLLLGVVASVSGQSSWNSGFGFGGSSSSSSSGFGGSSFSGGSSLGGLSSGRSGSSSSSSSLGGLSSGRFGSSSSSSSSSGSSSSGRGSSSGSSSLGSVLSSGSGSFPSSTTNSFNPSTYSPPSNVDICPTATTACACALLDSQGCGWSKGDQVCEKDASTSCKECPTQAMCMADCGVATSACFCATINGCGWSKGDGMCKLGASTDCDECPNMEECKITQLDIAQDICLQFTDACSCANLPNCGWSKGFCERGKKVTCEECPTNKAICAEEAQDAAKDAIKKAEKEAKRAAEEALLNPPTFAPVMTLPPSPVYVDSPYTTYTDSTYTYTTQTPGMVSGPPGLVSSQPGAVEYMDYSASYTQTAVEPALSENDIAELLSQLVEQSLNERESGKKGKGEKGKKKGKGKGKQNEVETSEEKAACSLAMTAGEYRTLKKCNNNDDETTFWAVNAKGVCVKVGSCLELTGKLFTTKAGCNIIRKQKCV